MLNRSTCILGILVSLLLTTVQAQRNCATHDVWQQQLQADPQLQQRMDLLEQQVAEYIKHNPVGDRTVVTIPVVFHVVYANATENISDAQIMSQLDVLNADFRALNSDVTLTPPLFAALVADCQVNFCLAQRDPSGNPTNGITRKSTTVTSWGTNDNVKRATAGGVNPWNRDQYLNIWVCNIGGGILGYAQFPGGNSATDGVVLDYRYVGTIGTATPPFNKGRTGTHEVAHWLGLRHIWGDAACGNDFVADTPQHDASNSGCPTYPHLSTCTGTPVEMTMNFMDYTHDACMYMFSQGQKTRIQAFLLNGGSRSSILNSPGCQPPTGNVCTTPVNLNTTQITTSSAVLSWDAVAGATAYTLQRKHASATTWTTTSSITGTSYSINALSPATVYEWRVAANCGSNISQYSATQSFTTNTASSSCSDTYEVNNTRNTAKVIPVNTAFTAQIASSIDPDWYRFSNSTTTPKIKIELTNLPADYDLKLFRSSSLMAASENVGTVNEIIIFNTTTVSSSYYAHVYGYNGAFSNTHCYTLKVSLSSANWRTDGTTDGEVTEFDMPVHFTDGDFGIYPNPAVDLITLDLATEQDVQAEVRIFDISGRAIHTEQVQLLAGQRNRHDMQLTNLNSGIYIVQLRNGSRIMTRRLVLQK